jgi:hypothetical protein
MAAKDIINVHPRMARANYHRLKRFMEAHEIRSASNFMVRQAMLAVAQWEERLGLPPFVEESSGTHSQEVAS